MDDDSHTAVLNHRVIQGFEDYRAVHPVKRRGSEDESRTCTTVVHVRMPLTTQEFSVQE